MNFRHLMSLAHSVARSGFLCLRFTCKGLNLTYRVSAYRAVVEYLKALEKFPVKNIFLGGRSMGARAAVALARQLCAEDEEAVQGVLCVSFPLHPPGQTHMYSQRSGDLQALSHVPVLFVSGTADNMCEQKLLEKVVAQIKTSSAVHWVEGASHGLTVTGRNEELVLTEVNSVILAWIQEHV
ncbi:testis-expressed protein 30 [Chanos chanos]|uniref:Testis-expressed protein 30 n=1 Tax=Chanos chanos TaxID=29144 RepID=A0A6J2WII5_CHACN|nr:testis-expressed protein 30 [Chanos chanos]